MSEQINKVLASTAQAFTTAEQKQARDNIGAMAASASSEFAPASAGFSGCSANAPITGDGTSGSPLGLSSRITLASAGAMNDMTPLYQQFTAGSLSSLHEAGYSNYEQAHYTSWIDPQKVVFKNDSGVQERVDYSSIDRWNSYSAGLWNESGNSLSTGYGGYQVSAASQYNETGNWAARTVSISGSPDQTMYGFQSKPNGTATYGVNAAGAFVRIPQQNYFTYLFHVTGAVGYQFDMEIFPTGLTADARFDFVNLCSAASANIKTDTFHGTTATINPGKSATMWYIATADVWTDGSNPVPV